MTKVKFLVILLIVCTLSTLADEIKLSLSADGKGDNSTFVATEEWQEIKPGQKVPQGLHYRMNLQTGKTEAKLLDPNEQSNNNDDTRPSIPISLQATEATEATESQEDPSKIEDARQRLEDALKNIPADKFDDVTEEKWKEVSKKFRTYEKIKEELQDVDLNPKTEAEVMQHLVDEFFDEKIDSSRRLEVLKDLEYLMHSIDNSLLFISSGGLEKIVVPNLVNQTDVNVRTTLLKMFGAMLQNNLQAKKYVSEKTNLGNEILNLMSKTDNLQELSAALYATGSLMRNNKILTPEIFKKSLVILLEILTKSSINLSIKVKDLLLISDLIVDQNIDENFTKSQKICDQIAKFFQEHRNALIIDTDAAEKCAASLLGLQSCSQSWSESPMFRHTLLVVMNNYKIRLNEESDEDIKFVYSLVIEHFENLNKELYGDLKISDDDLTPMYEEHVKDEL
ncbi:nucleotide exchange factor Sil1 [Chironomus tepperi]|uniref:nucleotide exchange factor Sil1 n=1 Tax=Chironomus tepperi TaxID=113505 RepID=UPI00391FB8EC